MIDTALRNRLMRDRIGEAIRRNAARNLERAARGEVVVLARLEPSEWGIPFYVVHRSARAPGLWQLTWFVHARAGTAPAGHDEFPSKEDAVASASGLCTTNGPPHGSREYVVVRALHVRGGRSVVEEFEAVEVTIP